MHGDESTDYPISVFLNPAGMLLFISTSDACLLVANHEVKTMPKEEALTLLRKFLNMKPLVPYRAKNARRHRRSSIAEVSDGSFSRTSSNGSSGASRTASSQYAPPSAPASRMPEPTLTSLGVLQPEGSLAAPRSRSATSSSRGLQPRWLRVCPPIFQTSRRYPSSQTTTGDTNRKGAERANKQSFETDARTPKTVLTIYFHHMRPDLTVQLVRELRRHAPSASPKPTRRAPQLLV